MEHINHNQISVIKISANSDSDIKAGASFITGDWAFGLCNLGSIDYMVNQESHHVDQGHCFSWLPGQVCTIVQLSSDADVILLQAPSDALVNIHPHLFDRSASTPTSISHHLENIDCFHQSLGMFSFQAKLPDQVCHDINQLLQVLSHHVHPLADQCNANMATSIIETISWILLSCHHDCAPDTRPLSRQESLTKDFFNQIIHNHQREHNVAFYAEQICVSPKYLSSVVRRITGSSPQDWIEKLLLFSSKRLLRSSDLTVAQVADKLCFSSSSAFVRFFRSNAGITPKDYRLSQQ